MIRVIYEWRVAPENVHEFNEAWKQTSTIVRQAYTGAHGSCLLREEGRGNTFLTIARWNSREEWQAFWTSDNPPEVTRMSTLAELVSVKCMQEIGNSMA